MRTSKQVILNALSNYLEDDLERAQIAFRGFSDSQLDAQYGQSGRTCRQILEGYPAVSEFMSQKLESITLHGNVN